MNKKIIQELIITDQTSERIDIYLAKKLLLSRSNIQSQLKNNLIMLNNEVASPKQTLKKGDKISLFQIEQEGVFQNDIKTIFENDSVIVINKPAGISAHPAPGEKHLTVYDVFKDKYSEAYSSVNMKDEYPLIVHRLDKGTSGVMILAKNQNSRDSLKIQFKNREVKKQYVALLVGDLNNNRGQIDLPIDRDYKMRGRFAAIQGGKEAITGFSLVEKVPGYSLVFAYPKTGRTHQIRVHFSSIGYPLFGDKRYSHETNNSNILLHAFKISFRMPDSGELAEFSAPLPTEFLLKLKELGFSSQTLSKLS